MVVQFRALCAYWTCYSAFFVLPDPCRDATGQYQNRARTGVAGSFGYRRLYRTVNAQGMGIYVVCHHFSDIGGVVYPFNDIVVFLSRILRQRIRIVRNMVRPHPVVGFNLRIDLSATKKRPEVTVF